MADQANRINRFGHLECTGLKIQTTGAANDTEITSCEEVTTSCTVTGAKTGVTADVVCRKFGNFVQINIPAIAYTAVASDVYTLSTLPSRLRPAVAHTFMVNVLDDTTPRIGVCVLATTGVITISPTADPAGTFTNTKVSNVLASGGTYYIL